MNNNSEIIRKSFKEKISGKLLLNVSLLLVIISLVIIFASVSRDFIGFNNVMNILRQSSVIAVIAIGMTLVIISGGIDLSVGSTVALGGAVGAIIMGITNNGMLGMLGALFSTAAIGLLNGFAIGRFNINPLMMTLATMALARGLTLGLLDARSVVIKDSKFIYLGQGEIGKVPVVIIFMVVLYILFYFILNKNSFGKRIYAIGGNILASEASGIQTKKIILYVYLTTGILAGFGSIITVGRLLSAQTLAGINLEFDTITAVIIGGTSLKGGTGSLVGTLLGVMVVGILTNGLSFLDLSPFFSYIVRGVILIIVVYIDNIINSKRLKV